MIEIKAISYRIAERFQPSENIQRQPIPLAMSSLEFVDLSRRVLLTFMAQNNTKEWKGKGFFGLIG